MSRQSRQLNSSDRRKIEATITALAVMVGMSDGITYCVCAACGRHAGIGLPARDGRRMELGHILPESIGGRFHITNLLPLCRRCNVIMADAVMTDVLTPRYTIAHLWNGKLLPDPGIRETNMDDEYEWLSAC